MINIKEDKRLNPLNHSCAHVLAQAVLRLYPKAKLWVGPVIPEGFYYDIDMGDVTLTEDDLPKIEKEMKKICKDGKRIVRHELTRDEALEMFKDNPYKVDIINNLPDSEVITAYSQGEFTDLCRGGHVDSVKECKNFKLLKVSGSYYKGDSKNKVLQRIYGVCFETKEDLESHLQELEEAKERDHRKLGRELGIFMLSDLVGKGFPLWLPNGFTLRHILSEYIMNKELENGYEHVLTPSLGSVDLYKTSGHWDHYKDDMFPPMKMDKEEYVLRPMNCPHHMMIYKNSLHSYRDLPIRIAEIAQDFRYEASGALCGLERARCFTQNDAHLFVRPDQIKEEFKKVIDLILDTYKDFGFKEYSFRLSLRDPNNKEKYFGNDELWERSENELREVLKEYGVDFYEAEGEAAFYGPKLDVQVKSAIGHDVTLSTVQLDYQLPEKFDIDYIAEDGSKQRAVVIHRAIFGSLDRFVAFLLEETKGALPLWLSPIQVSVIPVNNEYHLDYANEVEMALRKNKIRVHLDGRDEKLGYKLRESVTHKIPYALVLGDKEKDSKNVSFRKYGTDEQGTMSIDEFIEMLKRDENLKK